MTAPAATIRGDVSFANAAGGNNAVTSKRNPKVVDGGVCRKHGGREGSEGYTNYVVEGDVCRKHEVQHKVCIQCMEVSA